VATTDATTRVQRRQRREDVQTAIREAALELVRQGSSFKNLTVDEIARAAGMTRSGFYFYFRDKDELLASATQGVFDRLYEEADRWWHGKGDPRVRVRAALEGVVSVYAEHADLLRVVTEAASYDPEVRDFWRGLIERFVESTATQLHADQAAGRLSDVDPDDAAAQLVWMVERYCYVQIATGDSAPDRVAASLTRTWVAFLYRDGGSRS
jgi:AcrR family transcriptional regulator